MPRPKTILQSEYPYNITARCINREWFNLSTALVWEIFCEELSRTIDNKNLVVHSFVLMSNHFHLLASTPEANVSECMHQFMKRTSHRLTLAGNRINETFAGRHHKCIINNYHYFLNTYKYIYRNPVKAGICKKVEDYPFSTLRSLINPNEKRIEICTDTLFNDNPEKTLSWLNTAPHPEKIEAVKKALKHQFFKPGKNRNNGKPMLSDTEVL